MFETGVRQFRMAMGLVWGHRIDPDNLIRLVGDARRTAAEFGELGADARELVDGPFADPVTRAEFSDRALRRTARRLAAQSPFYARRFAAAGVDLRRLDAVALRGVPCTVKGELIERPAEFRCADSAPYLSTRTTGTTGRAAEIWMSTYELGLWSGLGALTAVLHEELHEGDVMQVHTSSRATAAVTLTAAICRLTGVSVRLLGVIPPDEALDSLVGSATLLSATPSYLAELVVAARRRGLGPADFRLRRIDSGGEILSPSVRQAALTTFGARVNDVFGMTEVMPVTAGTCSQGHLHHDISMGFVELVDLAEGGPARPGELATVVITPYFPFRECTPVFRYDTRDVVRVLAEPGPLDCELSAMPGTGAIVGKADGLLRGPHGSVLAMPRDLVEAVEALPSQPWPARFDARVGEAGLVLRLPRSAIAGLSTGEAVDHFAARGLALSLELVDDTVGPALRRLRSDLHELTFVSVPATIGV